MTRMVVLTPSFRGDYELCADLNRSVLLHAPATVEHHVVVPRRDRGLFERLTGARTHLHDENDFLPSAFVRLPGPNYTINLRHPFPPLRGWILQQVVKLAAAAQFDADVVLLVDSDIEFVRPFTAETFSREGMVRVYRRPGGIDESLPRHVIWNRVARSLLGAPPADPPFPDYISSLMPWNPALVREMLARVEAVTRRPWTSAVGAQLHFSEWTLYGVFVDEIMVGSANGFSSGESLCHEYWDETPLDEGTLPAFLGRIQPTDVAVMISAKSRTPLPARRAAMRGASSSPHNDRGQPLRGSRVGPTNPLAPQRHRPAGDRAIEGEECSAGG